MCAIEVKVKHCSVNRKLCKLNSGHIFAAMVVHDNTPKLGISYSIYKLCQAYCCL